jgi:hypothetical protein
VVDVLQFMDEQVVQRGKLGHSVLLMSDEAAGNDGPRDGVEWQRRTT